MKLWRPRAPGVTTTFNSILHVFVKPAINQAVCEPKSSFSKELLLGDPWRAITSRPRELCYFKVMWNKEYFLCFLFNSPRSTMNSFIPTGHLIKGVVLKIHRQVISCSFPIPHLMPPDTPLPPHFIYVLPNNVRRFLPTKVDGQNQF